MTDIVYVSDTKTVFTETPSVSYVQSVTVPPVISASVVSTVTSVEDKMQIIEIVTQGLQGAAGISGGSYIPYTATTSISGHRVVCASFNNTIIYADSSIKTLANSIIGITSNAGNIGDVINVQTSSTITEPSWNWVQNLPIFCSINGLLTQIQPTVGFSLIVATATSPTTILVGIKQPIIIS